MEACQRPGPPPRIYWDAGPAIAPARHTGTTTLTVTSMMRRLCSAVAVTLVLAIPFRVATAQSFPTDDPVLKRIWAIGMDSSRTVDFAAALLDSIGPRLAGSPGQKTAQDWLVKTYAAMVVTPLKIAIYWAQWNLWTLHDPSDFEADGTLRFGDAIGLSGDHSFTARCRVSGRMPEYD